MGVKLTRTGLARADAGRLAIFLDFDGCLVDIAARPQDVVVPRTLPPILDRLHRRTGGALAIVSGRSIGELRRFIPGAGAMICGSHGAERQRGSRVERLHVDQDALESAAVRAETELGDAPGLIVERKPVGLGLHYRGDPSRAGDVATLAESLLADLPGYHAHHGKMVVELRPNGVGKGGVVADLMRGPRFRGRLPVMMGDDTTDEPAFEAVNGFGGLSVKVGPGRTAALARLGAPAEVRRLLSIWATGGQAA